MEEFWGGFLVVATGETAEAYTPAVEGIQGFGGDVLHSTEFKSGKGFEGKNVLVVGAGNSGMEIALDLTLHTANTSLLVRSPVISFFVFLVSNSFSLYYVCHFKLYFFHCSLLQVVQINLI